MRHLKNPPVPHSFRVTHFEGIFIDSAESRGYNSSLDDHDEKYCAAKL